MGQKKVKKCDDVMKGLSLSYFCGQANQNTSLKDACEPTKTKNCPKFASCKDKKAFGKEKITVRRKMKVKTIDRPTNRLSRGRN